MNRDQQQQRQAAVEAAVWLARLDSGDATGADRHAHQRWLEASPINQEEYEAALRIFAQAASLSGSLLLETGLTSKTAPRYPLWQTAGTNTPYRGATGWLAAAVALCTVVLGTYALMARPAAQVFSTAIGERRQVTLIDGSMVTLNTNSILRVPKWGDTRQLELERGEAFFAIARDPERPFVAEAGGAAVRVLGTKFNIRLDDARATVAIVEGRVELSLPALDEPGSERNILAAGEGAIYGTDGSFTRAKQPQLDRITAWRAGKFVFEGTTLVEVVREVNRYSDTKVMIADSGLGELRITGTFSTDRIADLLQTLEKAAPIRIVTRGDTILLVAR